jgi:uncharacterized cupredoxin-like copper-binding protein
MLRPLSVLSALALSIALVPAAHAADTLVHVGLMDMTAVTSSAAYGGFGPGPAAGGRGFGMMGRGFGMMGGYGPGMMGGGMMSIRTDQPSVKAGKVSFEVTNWSRSLVHEVLVVAVDGPDAPLPYDYSSQRVVEDQVKSLGETGELQPNQSDTLSLELPAGTYLLVCNVAGHYAAGMATPLTVTP